MRKLEFKIEGQVLKKDPDCDFSMIVRGSRGYLQCSFSFDENWNGCTKVVHFYTDDGKSTFIKLVGDTCMVPDDVLDNAVISLNAIGVDSTRDYKITSTMEDIKQI